MVRACANVFHEYVEVFGLGEFLDHFGFLDFTFFWFDVEFEGVHVKINSINLLI